MPTMAESKIDKLFCLFKGEWGTRKSTQALSFPTPQYWFSYDQKMESLILPIRLWGLDENQIHYDDYKNWNAAEAKMKQLQVRCPYQTVVVDTLGLMGDATNIQTRRTKSGKDKEEGEEENNQEKKTGGKKVAGISVNSMEDYKAETAAIQDMMAMLKDIHKFHKVNIIIIAHVWYDKMPEGGSSTHISRVIVTGARQMAMKIPGYCHEVYHFNLKGQFNTDKQYALLTHHTRDDFARTALMIDKEIVFEDQPIYDNFIRKAIERTNNQKKMLPNRF